MGDLEFSGTREERIAQMEVFCRRISSDFYGNGRTGLMEDVQTFITELKIEKKLQERQHAQNRARLNLIIALLGLLCTILITIIAVKGLAKTAKILIGSPQEWSESCPGPCRFNAVE